MDTQYYQSKELGHNFGVDIDDLIRLRENAKINLTRSKMALIEMGAKTITSEGELLSLPNLDTEKYYKCNNQEFYWEAEYKDGTIVKQFLGEKESHYGHIDQSKLKTIRFVSNFYWDVSSPEKRVIVSLDWENGQWTFLNGFASQELRGFLLNKQFEKPAFEDGIKLILKAVKRQSVGVSFPGQEQGERTLYNRYLLGWENGQKEKLILCIEPNGYVHLWHDQ